MHLNTNRETSDLSCDATAHWCSQHGCKHYPDAKALLLRCDKGGSNTSNRLAFTEALHRLVDQFGLDSCIAHYPPYSSKHNPINPTDCLPM